jgi:aspartyl protease family protein
MFGFVMRSLTVITLLGLAGAALWENRETLLTGAAEAGTKVTPVTERTPVPSPVLNTSVYRADKTGHFYLEAAVNGSTVRFLVDTGATLVALRAEDARAAGINLAGLHYDQRVDTANGTARVARVTLRELRLDQLVVEDVDAMVIDAPLNVSLLGMSFLKRLDAYSMRDGQLVVSW